MLLVGSAIVPARGQAHVVSGGADFHVDAFGDAMDFANAEDHIIADEAMLHGVTNASIADGQLHFDADRIFFFSPLWGGYPTAIPHGRDGAAHPIDADYYRRIVFRLNAPAGVQGSVRWSTCIEQNESCEGGVNFETRNGWQTYDLGLDTNNLDYLPKRWNGPVLAVRIVLNPSAAAHFDVDWVRIVPDATSDVQELNTLPPPVALPIDRLDYATYAGNPWDFDRITDVQRPVNLRAARVAGNRFEACNVAADRIGDPGMVMNLPGGVPIDADRFKSLTVVYRYDGPFSVKNVRGGGVVARVFWFDEHGARHPTRSIVLYPNEHVVTVRLDGPDASGEVERERSDTARWGGKVTGFRFDPNQDPGDRCWAIERIFLTADEPPGASAAHSSRVVTSAVPIRARRGDARADRPSKTVRRTVKPTAKRSVRRAVIKRPTTAPVRS